jgi:4-hydroxy-tetrahydrodipicolinate synthase
MARKSEIFGLSCAITTPVKPGAGVDLARLATHATWVLENGCDSITLFGTTGEGAGLGLADRAAMFGAVHGAGIAPGRIHAGVAGSSLEDCIAQARLARQAGCDKLLVAPPYYFKGVSEDGLYAWFSRLIEGLGSDMRPMILYHIPQVTSVGLSSDLVGRLKRAYPGVIAGVKDSSCDWPTTERFLKDHAADLAILVGDERLLGRALSMGGEGTICGVANIIPQVLRALVHEGREDERINLLVEEVCRHPILAAIKALVGHVHQDAGYGAMLPPLDALDEAARRRIGAALDGILAGKAAA